MQIIADTHVHTISSGHAHATVLENIEQAKKKGLKFLGITDHATAIEGAPQYEYFRSLPKVLPRHYDGIYLLRGCEVNILNEQGDLDLDESILRPLDLVIASMHVLAMDPIDRAAHTRTWLNIAKNPNVDIIGHCGDQRFDFDHEPVIEAFAEHGKVVEINAHSPQSRPGSDVNCRDIARLCAKYSVGVVCSSDAHFSPEVGLVDSSINMLKEIGFPESLVLNADEERFRAFIEKCTGHPYPPLA